MEQWRYELIQMCAFKSCFPDKLFYMTKFLDLIFEAYVTAI